MSLIALVAAISFSSCDKFKTCSCTTDEYCFVDSDYVDSYVSERLDPTFSSLNDVLSYQGKVVDDYSTKEVFRQMPPDVLLNVANVLLRTNLNVTARDIVAEYLANKRIYDNLQLPNDSIKHPTSRAEKSGQDTITALQKFKPDSTKN